MRKPVLLMALYSFTVAIYLTVANASLAIAAGGPMHGPGSDGGGSGCRALLVRAAFQASQIIDLYGSFLTPKIDPDQFLLKINADAIRELDKDVELLDNQGNQAAIYFTSSDPLDGKEKYLVRCDRLEKIDRVIRPRLLAHEVLRRMKVEGDDWAASRQIFDAGVPRFAETARPAGQSEPIGTTHSLACSLIVEIFSNDWRKRNEPRVVFGAQSEFPDRSGPPIILNYMHGDLNAPTSTQVNDRQGKQWTLNATEDNDGTIAVFLQGPAPLMPARGLTFIGSRETFVGGILGAQQYSISLACKPQH